MKLVVAQVFPVSGRNPVAVVQLPGGGSIDDVLPGYVFRCGGLRYEVCSVHSAQKNDGQIGLELSNTQGHPIRQGMVLHSADDPMANDEFCSAMGRTVFIVRNLINLETESALRRLKSDNQNEAIEQFLEQRGVKDDLIVLLKLLDTVKKSLPAIDRLRLFDQAQGELNEKLKVLSISEGRSVIGDS